MRALTQTLAFARRPYATLRAHAVHDVGRLALLGEGEVVLFSHPDAIREIFRLSPAILRSANETVKYLLDGRSVVFLEGAEHRRHRQLMSTPFNKRLERFAAPMLAATAACTAEWSDGDTVDLHHAFRHITFDALMLAILGVRADDGGWDDLREALLSFVADQLTPTMFLAALTVGPRLRTHIERRVESAKKGLRAGGGGGGWSPLAGRVDGLARAEVLLEDLVRARREEAGGDPSVLGRFVEAGDVDDRDIVQEVLTLLIAGHDTTSLALSWLMVHLLQHPDAQARLRAELAPAWGADGPDPAAVAGTAYLDAVVTESMRLCPVAPLVPRRATEAVTVGGDVLPAGTRFAANIVGAHLREATWGDPDAFRPERFLDDPPDASVFLPFGGGHRRCIGAAFARYEIRLVLAALLQRWSMTLAPGRSLAPAVHGFLIGPADGVTVQLRRVT